MLLVETSMLFTIHVVRVCVRACVRAVQHRTCSIGLIRIRRTPPFSDDALDWAQLNPDESSELIHLIRKNYG